MLDEPKCNLCKAKKCGGCKKPFFTGYKPQYYFKIPEEQGVTIYLRR